MRLAFALFALLALLSVLSPSATAAQCPPVCVGAGVQPTLPSDGCGECVGAAAQVYTIEPDGCADCGGVGAGVGAEHDEDGTTVSAKVCRGGIVYICVVDEEFTL
jgi:hypothetical protein